MVLWDKDWTSKEAERTSEEVEKTFEEAGERGKGEVGEKGARREP
jgi:hypothetical protein